MPQRFTAIAGATLTALTAAAAVLVAVPVPAHGQTDAAPLELPPLHAGQDSLTVSVTGAGNGADGTYRLVCASDGTPEGGSTHPNAAGACAKLAQLAAEGQNPFVAPPRTGTCTMIYGGPATAHVTGTWQGRQIDADFQRSDGCAVARWNSLVPVLPSVGEAAAR